MKNVLLIILTLFAFKTFGQLTIKQQSIERAGFVIGFGVGLGAISINNSNREDPIDEVQGNIGFPNLKLGWMVNNQLAILGTLPGMNYEEAGNDRSFDAFIPTVQYWPKNRWWINGGLGLAMDFPAFHEVDDVKEEDWNFGYAISTSTGFELTQRKRYALDLQANLHFGRTFLEGDGHRDAIVFAVGLGFNWY